MPSHIVNLGSSFAAGPGIAPQADSAARRSSANYAHILARQLGGGGTTTNPKLTDLTVSGATLLNILREPQKLLGHTFPPQIDHVPGDADVVLVLGGGNDLGYIGGLIMDSLGAYWVFRVLLQAYNYWFASGDPHNAAASKVDEDNALTARYGEVLDAIHARAPEAHVVVVEYLTLIGPDAKPGVDVPLNAASLARHQGVAERLRMVTARALGGREAWCTRVAVAEASWEHGIGSAAPWVIGFGFACLWRREAWYHPNAEGMKAVADMVHRKLGDIGLVGANDK